MLEEVKPLTPVPQQLRGKQLIGILASLICLAAAVYVLWTTRDVLMFLLLIGVATGQIPIRQAIGQVAHRGRQAPIVEEEETEG
jgi:hypothetical protein